MADKNNIKLEIDKKVLKIVGIGILFLALLICTVAYGGFQLRQGIAEAKQEGYNKALVDIAYTVATKGGVAFVVPTTNITLALVQQK